MTNEQLELISTAKEIEQSLARLSGRGIHQINHVRQVLIGLICFAERNNDCRDLLLIKHIEKARILIAEFRRIYV